MTGRKPRTAPPRGADRSPRGPRRVDYQSAWHSAAIKRRLHAAAMTTWELADLLGVHEHQVDLEELPDLPVRLWLELARRLDLHPGDIIRGANELFALPRIADIGEAAGEASEDSAGDALTVITALAHAVRPLDADDLAAALDWPARRIDAAITHARHHPAVGGALVLRQVPPEHYTATPRLDLLTHGQHDQLVGPHYKGEAEQLPAKRAGRHEPLTAQETAALLTIFWNGSADPAMDYATEALRAGGLVQAAPAGGYQLTADVLDSLRLQPHPHAPGTVSTGQPTDTPTRPPVQPTDTP
ncbi:hypothetical protein ABTY61_14310 [Kitasatospora sp. NPDC096128]|uniref:hypothetical protein n=1 Tax=Kitasatospora sp. NPDC096128 TaxID=3155547 RepID=UPI00331DF34C